MSEPMNQPVPHRKKKRKKRRPRWQRILIHYWPLIRFILCALLVLTLVIVLLVSAVKAIIKSTKESGGQEQEQELQQQEEELTPEPEAPPPPATEAEVQAMVKETDFIAAGYDYDKSIEMLKTLNGWEDNQTVLNKISEYEAGKKTLVRYSSMNTITHIFFHTLIVDNARAFDGDENQTGYNQYMTTIPEFIAILESMYERGYVLVSPYDVAVQVEQPDGTTKFQYGEIWLPEGKKPFMMSQDDVNYYGYMVGDVDGINEQPGVVNTKGDGFAHKIIIDPETGLPTCEYMDAEGNVLTGDYDLVPVLETFIREHPDFSYRGARATLALTGYEGVLGYRTKPSYATTIGDAAWEKEVADAKHVAQVMREQGWDFASHSYGHMNHESRSYSDLMGDADKWENTVETIIGETDILIFPHGCDISDTSPYDINTNEKFAGLYERGFRYFFNVDNCVAWHQIGDLYFRGNRRNPDGFRMYHYPDGFDDLFETEEVWDDDRPTPVPWIG